jgi:anti-sigma factor RsiW
MSDLSELGDLGSHERLTTEERENLVPYLDGELDEQTTQALEAKLARSPEARQEAETLKRTWELLDYLPKPHASETFTNRTLERLETRKLVAARQERRWRWAGGLAWAASIAAAGVIGFFLARETQPPELPDPTAEDIRLFEHRDYWHFYEKVDGIEFLKELERSNLFSEES